MIKRAHFFTVCAIVFFLVILIASSIRVGHEKRDAVYKTQLKKYVQELSEFSDEEKQAIFSAIDYIENPTSIKNDRLISVYRISERFPNEAEIDLYVESGVKIEPDDWQVDIGDIGAHGNFSAIIDGETFEFIMQIPIA